MANGKHCDGPPTGPMTRPEYLAGSYLTADECAVEQNYRRQKLRRHNRLVHGWGVLCGLWVVPGRDAAHPWGVQVCPGDAIGPYGDEIGVRQAASIDISTFTWFRPKANDANGFVQPDAYVAIRYQEWTDGLTAVPGGGCQCPAPEYRASRTVDGFELGVVWQAPALPESAGICGPDNVPCAPCPDSPWVVLARISLPAAGVTIAAAMIDNDIRIIL